MSGLGPEASAINVTPELSRALETASIFEAMKRIFREAAIAQGLATVDLYNPDVLHETEPQSKCTPTIRENRRCRRNEACHRGGVTWKPCKMLKLLSVRNHCSRSSKSRINLLAALRPGDSLRQKTRQRLPL